ncbi:glycosyltransferase family 4 protein [Methylomonas rapida]|uniref:Glycosyltransferase n=1 Tax=Methylomonas rapida TaxID=2963939 RepID=A0ABY7GG49_9GAMM|nr:glycosyltransferase [Methylomonas rapida]WAR43804.1 glycosyltransferase [Methylomonas rapida]
MKVLFVITGLSTGGAEMMLIKVLEHLDRRRFQPYVISLSPLGELAPRISALGVSVRSVDMKGGLSDMAGFVSLLRMIKTIRPDVVHTWMYHADLLGGLAARLAGVKAIGWGIHNSNLDADKTKLSTRAIVRLCAFFSPWLPRLILSCSEQARLIHIEKGYAAEKMVVVPNGFDLMRFKPDNNARHSVRKELGLMQDVLLVGLIGRFDPQKNHAGFFRAAGYLLEKMPSVRFLLAGKNIASANSNLLQMAKDAGVLENCHFLGLRDDIPRLMAALDVLASSSDGEAFPNVLGEAMASGVPCAVTDAGDSAVIVGDVGRSVAVGDMRGLAVAMQELLCLSPEEKQSLSEKIRHRVLSHYEISQVVRDYEDFYIHLTQDNGPKCF